MDPSIRDKYETVIGLEVHAQLSTLSKIYAADSTAYGMPPNTNISIISLAHPGTLPRLNRKVVELAIRMGLACRSEISREQIFDRKNYFYPDLPKGYQLTQDRTPICVGGFVAIETSDGRREIPLNRVHIEEDAGKSIHTEGEADTLVDLNRAGVGLIEIVTEPALRSPAEAGAFLTEVRRLVRYLEICDGNMEEGSLRCDANVSVRLHGASAYGRKVEIKNLNSIKNVQKAIAFEVERQISIVEKGEEVLSETRLFNVDSGRTYGMRTKEELNDYRYFPDPDLSPLHVSEEWLQEIEASMPRLPWEMRKKLVHDYGLPDYDAGVLTDSKELAVYFEEVCKYTSQFKAVSNWIMGPLKSWMKEQETSNIPLVPERLAQVVHLVGEGRLSFSIASQKLFPALINDPQTNVEDLVHKLGLIHDTNDDSIAELVDQIILDYPDKVKEYRSSKKAKGLIGMFMGELMKRSKGKADPKKANELLLNKLG